VDAVVGFLALTADSEDGSYIQIVIYPGRKLGHAGLNMRAIEKGSKTCISPEVGNEKGALVVVTLLLGLCLEIFPSTFGKSSGLLY
jgi:hypothetical protein